MSYYKCSDGTKIGKSIIDRKVREAKAKKIAQFTEDHGYIFCFRCMQHPQDKKDSFEFKIFDCAHLESVDSCQKNHRSEKAWDVSNIEIMCRFHHRQHDKS